MTFGEMIDRVRLTLGMSETISNDESVLIKAWINEGVIDFVARTRAYSRVINLTVQPGIAVHDMANTIIALVDVELPDVGFLRRYSRQDIVTLRNRHSLGFAYEEPLFWFSPIVDEPTVIRAYGIFPPVRDDGQLARLSATRTSVGWPMSSTRLSSTTSSGGLGSTSSTRGRPRVSGGGSPTRVLTATAGTLLRPSASSPSG